MLYVCAYIHAYIYNILLDFMVILVHSVCYNFQFLRRESLYNPASSKMVFSPAYSISRCMLFPSLTCSETQVFTFSAHLMCQVQQLQFKTLLDRDFYLFIFIWGVRYEGTTTKSTKVSAISNFKFKN